MRLAGQSGTHCTEMKRRVATGKDLEILDMVDVRKDGCLSQDAGSYLNS